ncbi:MAG: family transcriptional regulator, cyclic receptor protein [Pseudonocardiales bacterium]|nr:family transcriptional regulator, cyclic receptor protein [Pseudonocardiales bacterium]
MDVTHLDGLPLFDGLSKKERQLIAQHADEVDLPAGEDLVENAALAWEFFVIRQGTVDISQGSTKLRSLGPGDFFGEIGVLAPDRRRTAGVVTTSPVKAIVMTAHELRAVAHQVPEVAQRLGAAMTQRLQNLP